MSKISRRKIFAGAAGATGLFAAARVAQTSGLIAPDSVGPYGLGETLNYAAHRLTSGAHAREFPRSAISKEPFADPTGPLGEEFLRMQEGGFADWRLEIEGMVAKPVSLSLEDLKRYPSHSHITHLACEEGWSYVAEWMGVPLSAVLEDANVLPQARYLAYFSMQPGWWDSVDLDEARHPQTLLAYAMNGAELPVPLGGPLRMRVPRQLGYKNVKYVTRLTVTDDLKTLGDGLGSAAPSVGYSWYAGI